MQIEAISNWKSAKVIVVIAHTVVCIYICRTDELNWIKHFSSVYYYTKLDDYVSNLLMTILLQCHLFDACVMRLNSLIEYHTSLFVSPN